MRPAPAATSRGRRGPAVGSRCGVCASPLPPREPGAPGQDRLYCDPATGRPCHELTHQIEALRTRLIPALAATAGRRFQGAMLRVRRECERWIALLRHWHRGTVIPAPQTARREPGAAPGPNASRDAARSWCAVCGWELPPREPGQRGRPAVYCDPATGRPCREIGKRQAAIVGMIETTYRHAADPARCFAALAGARGELGLLPTVLDNVDTAREARK